MFRKNSAVPETPVDIPPSPKVISEPISITREKSPTPTEKSDGSKSRGSRRPKLSPKVRIKYIIYQLIQIVYVSFNFNLILLIYIHIYFIYVLDR